MRPSIFFREHLPHERHCVRRSFGKHDRPLQNLHRLGQHLRLRRVHRCQRLPFLNQCPAPRMKQNPRMRIDRLSRLLTPRAGPLHGDPQLFGFRGF